MDPYPAHFEEEQLFVRRMLDAIRVQHTDKTLFVLHQYSELYKGDYQGCSEIEISKPHHGEDGFVVYAKERVLPAIHDALWVKKRLASGTIQQAHCTFVAAKDSVPMDLFDAHAHCKHWLVQVTDIGSLFIFGGYSKYPHYHTLLLSNEIHFVAEQRVGKESLTVL